MATTVKEDRFLRHLDDLYEQIERWLGPNSKYRVKHSKQKLTEGETTYTVPVLSITGPSGFTLRVKPAGVRILGAAGRVDLMSNLGSEMLLLTVPGVRWIEVRRLTEDDERLVIGKDKLLSDKDLKWAWANPAQRGVQKLDRRLFLKLLESLSP